MVEGEARAKICTYQYQRNWRRYSGQIASGELYEKDALESCKKKMPTETCDCYADRIAVRYNETQTLSIYQRMIKDKKSQEMFFLSTSPELLDCMDNQDK